MKNQEIQNVLKRIQTVVHHFGTFEGSFPRILKDAPIYTRSHLIVVYEALPYLNHILKFAGETVPTINQMLGMADHGTSDLAKASQNLKNINSSAEMAVTEIFGALDELGGLLRKAQQSEDAGGIEGMLQEANSQLMAIMNALQFQDINAQQIEATHALLARLGDGLNSLVEQLGISVDSPSIEVRTGTFDEHARFNRETAREKQGEIDQLVDGDVEDVAENAGQEVSVPSESETGDQGPPQDQPEAASPGGDTAQTVGQDDIDSLIASTEENPEAPSRETSGEEVSQAVSQDDIDSLLEDT